MQVEREKCLEASKHAKNVFLTKKYIFTQISKRFRRSKSPITVVPAPGAGTQLGHWNIIL